MTYRLVYHDRWHQEVEEFADVQMALSRARLLLPRPGHHDFSIEDDCGRTVCSEADARRLCGMRG
jgi:hypothetical protein